MILTYHKVDTESPIMWWVDADNFYRQMCELNCRKVVYLDGYDVNDPDQVVITFDGIYKNVLEYAVPILKEFGYPFELFITSDYIGKDNSFDEVEPKADFASIDDLKEMIGAGGRLQWHTRTHRNLKDVTDLDIICSELSISHELRALDKKGFKWFAYPYGNFNEIIVNETRKQFKGGLSCNQGNDLDLFKLNRITVTNETTFKKGTIAVVIASYNYGSYLIEAIESVLKQTRPVDEIFIADDCSSDNTPEIAGAYENKYPHLIRYMRNDENLGIVRNFNKAVSLTKSDYICILGADNRFRSDYIEKTSAVLDADDTIGIAYSDFALFDNRALIVYNEQSKERRGGIKENYYIVKFPDFNEEARNELLYRGNFIHGSSMFKRKAFEEVDGYKEEKSVPEDYNLFRRIVKQGWDAKRVAAPILEYRQHSREQTNIKLSSYLELVFYKEMVRQREAQIYNTWSWKITAPLRSFGRILIRFGIMKG